MKKLLALLLVLVMCVGVLVACKPDEVEGPSLDQAKEYLNGIMKDGNGKATPNDYDVVGKVIIEGTSFEVTWTTNKENITVKESSKANLWTIDVPETNAEELAYEITATIKNAAGETVQVTFNKVLPVLDTTGVVTAPVEGTNYKLFLEQVNLGYTLYAKAESQNGENKYILTTLDPKEAADFQVEVVDDGYKIYTMIDGVKNYVHAKGVDNNGKVSKYIGFATESDVVYKFNAELNTFVVDIDGIKYGVGTYNAFETICISEITYFNSGNINVEGGQFPVGFMLSSYAETLEPDEKPVASDPTPDSTLTIKEAIDLGNTKVKDQYTEGKYYVTGVITEVYNEQYGNMYITDGNGNTLCIYGTYSADGSTSYKDLATKPVAGDTVTVYGIIGKYNDPQMKNGWITAHTPGEGGDTPVECEHVYENGSCTKCGAKDPDYVAPAYDAPVAGTAYKLQVAQNNLGKTLYFNGLTESETVTYRLQLVENAADAVDVFVEVNDGQYKLYFMNGETKTYIVVAEYQDNDNDPGYGKGTLTFETSTELYYSFDTVSGTLLHTDAEGEDSYYLGTYNTYNTISVSNASYITGNKASNVDVTQFPARLVVLEGGDTPGEGGGETPVECEHEYVDGVCTKCGEADPDYVAPSEHVCVDADGNFVCDEASCGKQVLPAADSVLTIEQALALGNLYAKDAYTDGKYYVTGTITEVYSTKYGNMYITDGTNTLCVYGSYDATGANRYDAAATKWVAGDNVTVYGVIGKYNDPQMKNGWVTVNSHEHAYADATCAAPATCPCGATQGEALAHTWDAATCTAPKTCSVCGAKEGDALGHTYVEGVCSVCGATEPVAGEKTTVTVSIADYATANGWTNSTLYAGITLDENVSVTTSGTPVGNYGLNTGKYYSSGNNWRIYQNENPSVTITAAEGKTIVSVKITYSIKNTGTLTLNGENIASGTVVEVNANSVTFSVGNTGTATNGQAQITAIEVVYQ